MYLLCLDLLLCYYVCFCLMIRRPPISTRTDTLFPYTTLFRSVWMKIAGSAARGGSSRTRVMRAAPIVHRLKASLSFILVATVMLLRSEEHTSELQSLMRISYAVFCLKKKNNI